MQANGQLLDRTWIALHFFETSWIPLVARSLLLYLQDAPAKQTREKRSEHSHHARETVPHHASCLALSTTNGAIQLHSPREQRSQTAATPLVTAGCPGQAVQHLICLSIIAPETQPKTFVTQCKLHM